MRVLIVLLTVLLTACGGSKSPTAPTPPPNVFVAPPVTVTPTPPPTPTITNYAGAWRGFYLVESCFGSSGSMGDVLCSAPRPGNPGGIFQTGRSFPISLDLSQSGTTVSGGVSFGSIRGNLSGSVRADQSLVLSGSATQSSGSTVLTLTTTDWNTIVSGGRLEGSIGIGLRFNDLPGDGVVRARLSSVTR